MKYNIYLLLILFALNSNYCFSQIQNPKNIEYNWRTDIQNSTINISEIQAVLPRNSFPKLDFPKFISKKELKNKYNKEEPVISIEINGEAKAYPLSILTMHEISNDILNGIPILSAYCPLCNTAVVYDRRLNIGDEVHTLEFEVSGMLRNSNLIIYDFLSETWWQHMTGKGLAGEYAGRNLKLLPSQIISVEEFFNRYPEGMILSPNTGSKYEKQYGTIPYEKYDDPNGLPYERFFKKEKIDKRLPAMERVVSVNVNDINKVYPYNIINKKGVINDDFENKNIVIFYKEDMLSVLDKIFIPEARDIGSVSVYERIIEGEKLSFIKKKEIFTDSETGSEWNFAGLCVKGKFKGKKLKPIIHGIHFSFAWLEFYPGSIIYSEK